MLEIFYSKSLIKKKGGLGGLTEAVLFKQKPWEKSTGLLGYKTEGQDQETSIVRGRADPFLPRESRLPWQSGQKKSWEN